MINKLRFSKMNIYEKIEFLKSHNCLHPIFKIDTNFDKLLFIDNSPFKKYFVVPNRLYWYQSHTTPQEVIVKKIYQNKFITDYIIRGKHTKGYLEKDNKNIITILKGLEPFDELIKQKIYDNIVQDELIDKYFEQEVDYVVRRLNLQIEYKSLSYFDGYSNSDYEYNDTEY